MIYQNTLNIQQSFDFSFLFIICSTLKLISTLLCYFLAVGFYWVLWLLFFVIMFFFVKQLHIEFLRDLCYCYAYLLYSCIMTLSTFLNCWFCLLIVPYYSLHFFLYYQSCVQLAKLVFFIGWLSYVFELWKLMIVMGFSLCITIRLVIIGWKSKLVIYLSFYIFV